MKNATAGALACARAMAFWTLDWRQIQLMKVYATMSVLNLVALGLDDTG